MFIIYLACLVFGGVLLVITLFSGADSDVSADHSIDFHGDAAGAIDAHVDFDHSVEIATDTGDIHPVTVESDADIQHHHPGAVEAVKFLSFRNIVFFMAFFGLTGSALTWLAIPALITFLASVGMGYSSAYFGYRLLKYLKKTESGQVLNLAELRGHLAKVTIGFSRMRRGKIAAHWSGHTLQLIALSAEESSKDEFVKGDTVIISRVENGVAYVIESDYLETSS